MSSKILLPPGGLPHAATPSKAEQRAKARPQAPSRGARRTADASSAAAESTVVGAGHGGEGELFGDDKREEPHADPRGRRGSEGSGAPSTRPQSALAPRQATGGPMAHVQRSAASSEGRRPEHSHWARLIAQASPERLAQGQALLGQHETALEAFARLVPGFAKPR